MSGVYRRCRLVSILPPPFPTAKDIDTEPGLGALQLRQELAAEKATSARLRSERNAAREELASSPSVPPPTRRQKAVGGVVGTVQWVGVATLLLTAAVQIASAYRPGLVGPLQQILQLLGGQ